MRVTRESRKGANEAWFREVNERLEDRAAGQSAPSDAFEIVCECAREECTERIAIDFAAYEAVRRIPTRFIVVRGASRLRPANDSSRRPAATTSSRNSVTPGGLPGLRIPAMVKNRLMGQKRTELQR